MTVIRRGRNRISGRRLIILFLVIGILAGSLVLLYLYKERMETDVSKEQIPDRIYGVVLTDSLGSDEILREEQLREVELTKDARGLNVLSKESVVGKKLRIGLSSNTLLTQDMIESEEELPNDLRRHAFHFIETTDKLSVGDYVDIRISFPNGADFIVLSKKRVLDYSSYNAEAGTMNTLWLELSEEEILQLSSAVVDAYYNAGSFIYAIEYVDANQEKAKVTYPVNDIVSKLIEKDPNIVSKAKQTLSNQLRSSVTKQLEEYERTEEYSPDRSMNQEATNEYLTNGSSERDSWSSFPESVDGKVKGKQETSKDEVGKEENYTN